MKRFTARPARADYRAPRLSGRRRWSITMKAFTGRAKTRRVGWLAETAIGRRYREHLKACAAARAPVTPPKRKK